MDLSKEDAVAAVEAGLCPLDKAPLTLTRLHMCLDCYATSGEIMVFSEVGMRKCTGCGRRWGLLDGVPRLHVCP